MGKTGLMLPLCVAVANGRVTGGGPGAGIVDTGTDVGVVVVGASVDETEGGGGGAVVDRGAVVAVVAGWVVVVAAAVVGGVVLVVPTVVVTRGSVVPGSVICVAHATGTAREASAAARPSNGATTTMRASADQRPIFTPMAARAIPPVSHGRSRGHSAAGAIA
jgi:hypothetical protein